MIDKKIRVVVEESIFWLGLEMMNRGRSGRTY